MITQNSDRDLAVIEGNQARFIIIISGIIHPLAQPVLGVRNEGKKHDIVKSQGSDLVDSMA
jgi:hypothetical protein